MVDDVHYIRGIHLPTFPPVEFRTHEPPYDADDVTLHAHCIFVEAACIWTWAWERRGGVVERPQDESGASVLLIPCCSFVWDSSAFWQGGYTVFHFFFS